MSYLSSREWKGKRVRVTADRFWLKDEVGTVLAVHPKKGLVIEFERLGELHALDPDMVEVVE